MQFRETVLQKSRSIAIGQREFVLAITIQNQPCWPLPGIDIDLQRCFDLKVQGMQTIARD